MARRPFLISLVCSSFLLPLAKLKGSKMPPASVPPQCLKVWSHSKQTSWRTLLSQKHFQSQRDTRCTPGGSPGYPISSFGTWRRLKRAFRCKLEGSVLRERKQHCCNKVSILRSNLHSLLGTKALDQRVHLVALEDRILIDTVVLLDVLPPPDFHPVEQKEFPSKQASQIDLQFQTPEISRIAAKADSGLLI